MSDARPPDRAVTRWYARPRLVLSIIAVLVLVSALLAPEVIAGRTGNSRLSTLSTEPQGARLFAELAGRLGWRVERRRVPEIFADSSAIHAVLSPALSLRRGEAHALLEHVRAGGALLLVLGGDDPLADSLHLGTGPAVQLPRAPDADTAVCAAQSRAFVPLWPDNRVLLSSLRWKGPPPERITTFVAASARPVRVVKGAAVDGAETAQPTDSAGNPPEGPLRLAAIGFPFGRGRIVVGSDPDLFRNDVIRSCAYGVDVPAVRMLEYLRDGGETPRRRLVFDEYHQGYGSQPGTLRAIGIYLGRTPSGRLLLQLIVAGLVLLSALAPRTIAPREAGIVERRSPLEHVEALARAYDQVGATRTATLRLLRGLRRRVERDGVRGREPDADFLARAAEAAPALAADVALIQRALATRSSRRELGAVGEALHRLELTLTRT